MKAEKELLQALSAIDKIDTAKARRAAAGAVPYCAEYCAARPYIPVVLKALALVPFIGPRAVALIKLLMKIADSVCQCSK